MKLACQEQLVPGKSLAEELANLEGWGYEGIEFRGAKTWERVDEVNQVLAQMEFDKYMALACSVPGDPHIDLLKAAEYLRAQMP